MVIYPEIICCNDIIGISTYKSIIQINFETLRALKQ